MADAIKDLQVQPIPGEEQIKEDFSSKISDASLIALIDGWLTESSSYFEEIKKVIEVNLEYYRGNQTDLAKIRGKNSKAVENRIFIGTETIVPIVTANPPDMVVESPNNDEKGEISADRLQKALNFHYEDKKIKDLAEKWVRDMILKRFAVFKIDWDKKTDDVSLKVIDPKRIRFVRFGQTVDELPAVLEQLEMSYKGVKDYFGEKIADELLKEKAGEIDENKKRKTAFLIWEVWTNEFTVWKAGDKILKKEDNRWYDFKDLKKNHFEAPRKPYIIKSLFQTDETLIGETDLVTQVIPIQDNINKRKRQIENLSAKVANPPLLIDSDTMDEETASSLTNEEGQIIYGKDVAQPGKIRFETPGQVPQYLFEDLVSSRNEFDNIFGTHSTTRGERTKTPTLGQDILAQKADLGRIDAIKRRFDSAVGEIADFWTQCMRLYYDTDRFIEITGKDGEITNFTVDDIEDGVKVTVKEGTVLPTNEVFLAQQATQLAQLGFLDPLTLYEKLKFANPRETFARLANFRTGKMFAEVSSQGALPAESGTPSAENLGQLAGAGVSQTTEQNLKQGRAEISQSL